MKKIDDFRSDIPPYCAKGFPWHPPRDIKTITCVPGIIVCP
jgi:redox-sensitive bicupin YhaK (pirin superfamily)